MRIAALLFVVLAVFGAGCMQYSPELERDAQIRVQQLAESDQYSHEGFTTLSFSNPYVWHGELLLKQDQPITFGQAVEAWRNSPRHAAVLALGQSFGYAQTDTPSAGGWYYAAMELEWR